MAAGVSVSYEEEKIVCVPAKTSKMIREYAINKEPYRNCNLFRYPGKKQLNSVSFSKEDSPYVFSNRIAYYIPGTEGLFEIENEFYISEIANYQEKEITEMREEQFCGKKSGKKFRDFINASPDKFFIIYTKDMDSNPH